jgi:predicted solute-binding protein
MPREKKIEEAVRLSVVLSKKHLDQIKKTAIRMSFENNRNITVSEAIRLALEEAYPMPKEPQAKMFPG